MTANSLLNSSILGFFLCTSFLFYASGNYVGLLGVCVLAQGIMVYWTLRSFGIFDSRTVFLAVSSLYPFTAPFDVLVLGGRFFDAKVSSLTLLLSISFFMGFFIFSSLDLPSGPSRIHRRVIDQRARPILLVLLWLAFGAYLALFYRDVGFAIGERSRTEVIQAESPIFATVRLGLMIGLLVLVSTFRDLGRFGRRAAAVGLIGLFCLVEIILLGDRRFVLTFALAAICIWGPRRIPISVIAPACVVLPVMSVYPIVRNTPISDWASTFTNTNVLQSFNPANIEFGAFGRVADDILSTQQIESFPTYWDAVLTLIPQALYPDRPEPAGIWFVHTYYPKTWEAGGGYAFNLVIEALLNLGLIGPLVLGAVVGLGFNVLIGRLHQGRLSHGLLVFTLVFAMRFDMATLLKTVAIVAVMTVVWLTLSVRPWAASRQLS